MDDKGDNEDRERKRSYDDQPDTSTSQASSKRLKGLLPDEILGSTDDSRKCTTRLMVNKTEFSKIIGKGGNTLHQIKSSTHVNIKAADVNDEMRVVVMTGSPRQVIDAFDVVSELLRQASGFNSPSPVDKFSVEFLVEPSKVGRIVGVKGATINSIKSRSGLSVLKINKEPQDITGVQLQSLQLEGGLNEIRRCHYYILELHCDPSALLSAATVSGGSSMYYDQQPPPHRGRSDDRHDSPRTASGPVGYGVSTAQIPPHLSLQSFASGNSNIIRPREPLPFSTLTNFGVLSETVRQLTDMKAYLQRHFHLDLTIFHDEPQSSPVNVGPPNDYLRGAPSHHQYESRGEPRQLPHRSNDQTTRHTDRQNGGGGYRDNSHGSHGPDDIVFNIPKETVGTVIGKGGHTLKDLQSEFGFRVFIEKDEAGILRNVVISAPAPPAGQSRISSNDSLQMQRCRDKILKIVQTQLELISSRGSSELIPIHNDL